MEPLQITTLEKSYDGVRALDGLSLEIEPGTLHAIVGPNGSGKTTLFRILLGLARPDGGSVSMPAATVGCGFQHPRFYADLSVAENLSVFADLADAPAENVEQVADACRLDRELDRRAGDLSGGLAKRLDLALALVADPDVLLLDEPLADVDDGSKPVVVSRIEEHVAPDRIVVVTSHQLPAFADVLDRVTVLQRGSIQFDGPPEDLDSVADSVRDGYLDVLEEG